MDGKDIPPKTRASIELLKKNLKQFEADGAIGALISLARRAQRENKKFFIGLETDWIPGIEEIGYGSQHDAINLLLKEIRAIGEALKRAGLDNVEIVEGNKNTLAGALIDKIGDPHIGTNSCSNVVVFASTDTIRSESFDPLRSTSTKKGAFFAGIDASKITSFYNDNKDILKSSNQQLRIRVMSMLLAALELAVGKDQPNIPMIRSYDKDSRIVIFLPEVEIINYQNLVNEYAAERTALAAALSNSPVGCTRVNTPRP